MRKIVQIEELRYGRRECYDEAALDEMIECFKNDYEDELPQASLSPFYPLIERTIYQFDEGKLTGSERTFYLLGRQIRNQKFVEWYPDWNREAPTAYYDAKRDEYVVRHIRYDVDKNKPRFISQALAEADYPSKSKDVQAPPETRATAPQPAPQPRPIPQPAPQPKPAPAPVPKPQPEVTNSSNYPNAWRLKRLKRLKELYESGYNKKQLIDEFQCSEHGLLYQIKNYLGIEHPFEQKQDSTHEERGQMTAEQKEKLDSLQHFIDLVCTKWPKKKLEKLKELYIEGKTAKEIARELQCPQDEMLFQLSMRFSVKNPFREMDKTPWNSDQDELLQYLFVLRNGDVDSVAELMRRNTPTINKRLYELIGRLYEGMPREEKTQRIIAETKRNNWTHKKKKIQAQIEAEWEEERQENKRKAEDEAKKVNGFYRPGVQVNHPKWGFITVIKDDENVLKYVTLDGIRRTIRK